MNSEILDDVLNKISMSFGNDSLELVIPHDTVVNLSMYRVSAIDIDDLDGELIFQPKLYTLFSALLSYVSEKTSHAYSSLKRLESTLSLQYEKQLTGQKERATDKKIMAIVESDESYIVAHDMHLDYKNMIMVFQNILKSLDKKGDSLLQLSKKRMKEMDSGNVS